VSGVLLLFAGLGQVPIYRTPLVRVPFTRHLAQALAAP